MPPPDNDRDYPAAAFIVYRTVWLSRRAWRRRDARIARENRAAAVRRLRSDRPKGDD